MNSLKAWFLIFFTYTILMVFVKAQNRPQFCTNATWSLNATTFANSTYLHNNPEALFITRNDTMVVTQQVSVGLGKILIWHNASSDPYLNSIPAGITFSSSIFVTDADEIIVHKGNSNHQVDSWSLNGIQTATFMQLESECAGLYLDFYNALYCSRSDSHHVFKKLLDDQDENFVIVAGTSCPGTSSSQLNNPRGIIVTEARHLYVADCGNDRVQLFWYGETNAITVVGSGSSIGVTLSCPSGLVLDADGYLFISDKGNHRIVGQDANGFRCILGCSGVRGSASDQLSIPNSLAFDSLGNIFVMDSGNDRIQKYLFITSSCYQTTIGPSNTTITPIGSNTTMSVSTIISNISQFTTSGNFIQRINTISYNKPKICPNASWNPNATTFADRTLIGVNPTNIFVNKEDTIFAIHGIRTEVMIWKNHSMNSTSIIPTATISSALFVTSQNEIYIHAFCRPSRIEAWNLNGNLIESPMIVSAICADVFLDIDYNIYCTQQYQHRVIKKWFDRPRNAYTVIAGQGAAGSSSFKLDNPIGLFVTATLNLYVADSKNDRIQLFRFGQRNATTVAGNGAPGTISLKKPTAIVLDDDGYLFIVDSDNHRIVGSGPYGFRCVAGCSGVNGSSSDQLAFPTSMHFDSNGNMMVVDRKNNRIQKFFIADNDCDQTTTNSIVTSSQTEMVTSTDRILSSAGMSACYAPKLVLIPSTSTQSMAIQIRRDQDFYMGSTIELNCNESLATNNEWKIKNCSTTTSPCLQMQIVDSEIQTTFNDIYIPSRTLPVGLYEFQLTVKMNVSTTLTSSVSAYIKITASGIIANLIQLGTSIVTSGSQQDLRLDPGTFSIDPDNDFFNASEWSYEYYCRIYGVSNFPHSQGVLIPLTDSSSNLFNESCFSHASGTGSGLKFDGVSQSLNSAMIIYGGSLRASRTYQFMVYMENKRNNSFQATGFVSVEVQNNYPKLIAVGCVITSLCRMNLEFQLINPTTQVALYSVCHGNCTLLSNISWNIFQGSNNGSKNITQWNLYSQTTTYENIWFFGRNTSNFTASHQIFINNPNVSLWKFQVTYSFPTESTLSALNFMINKAPENGSCTISPTNGTTTTLFNISCPDWSDQDGIKDYALYLWSTNPAQRSMIAFSSISTFEVRLPSGIEPLYSLRLVIIIRDTLDCVTEFNLTTIFVYPDSSTISELIQSISNSSGSSSTNTITGLLATGNQNTVNQVISSVSQQLNSLMNVTTDQAISNGMVATSISVGGLGGGTLLLKSSSIVNQTLKSEFEKAINNQARIREYLSEYAAHLSVTNINTIKVQARTFAELTGATNALTRTTLILASGHCYRLAKALRRMSEKIPSEDFQMAATQILKCAANVLTAVEAPLQERTMVLDSDFDRATMFPTDYDTDLEFEWSNLNTFADGDDFSVTTIQRNRNRFSQKQSADQIRTKLNEIYRLLTTGLSIHLNRGQMFLTNTSSIVMLMETLSLESLSKKNITLIENAKIVMPQAVNISSFQNGTTSLLSMIEPLAPTDSFKHSTLTNLSRSMTISLIDENGNTLSLNSSLNECFELFIPRDPQYSEPTWHLQNVSSMTNISHNLIFNLHYLNMKNMPNVSIHMEMKPLNHNLSYLLIYNFDQAPIFNSSTKQIQNWTLLCPTDLTNESIYTHFINNDESFGRGSVIFGLRELNSTEMIQSCSNKSSNSPPITEHRFQFTADYELRYYTSGCYRLDENQHWTSDGLTVGPLTNRYQTHCLTKTI